MLDSNFAKFGVGESTTIGDGLGEGEELANGTGEELGEGLGLADG